MEYQLTLNGSPIFQGNIFSLFLALIVIAAIGAGVIITIWRKLRENEVLKYEFITIIAHKFRTPLTHLKWLLEELVGSEQDSSRRENLADLQQSTDHLINLTGTLIEMTNADQETKSSYKLEIVPLCELTRTVSNSFKNVFHAKNISFSVQCPVNEISARIDRARVEFILQTLLENSYNYTPPGRQAAVTLSERGRKAVISVSDNGIGIGPGDLSRIFTKFYRAKNAREMDTEGFGVGLFLAQSIIQRLGGKIEAFSEGINRGSTFSIVLPIAK